MFQFLQPIWLFAIGGIVVPLLIHLWNVKQGKTLKIGSIALLTPSSRQNARSWRLLDLLLLVLRSLIVTVLALLLAQPIWSKTGGVEKQKGWILIEEQDFRNTYSRFKTQVDSLARLGYEIHYFNPGFEKVRELNHALEISGAATVPDLSYWDLLKELEATTPADRNVFLFTGRKLHRITGTRPVIKFNLTWKTYGEDDAASEWIEEARLIDENRMRILKGRSNSNSTTYDVEDVPVTGSAEVGTSFQNGKLAAFFKKDTGGNLVEVDTLPLKIAMYTDRFPRDADYLQAALEAIRAYDGRRIQTLRTGAVTNLPATADWLFWLSEKPIPENIRARNRFIYPTGKPTRVISRIKVSGIEEVNTRPIELYKEALSKDVGAGEEVIWENGFGNAILSVAQRNGSKDFHFFTHFDPAWNDLVWRPEFPELIQSLIISAKTQSTDTLDQREAAKIDPIVLPGRQGANGKTRINESLDKVFWIIAFCLLVAERIVSFLKKGAERG